MPAVSAAASWMDTFKLSMREIRKRYTKSEMVLMAWDSKQKAFNMDQQFKTARTGTAKDTSDSGVLKTGYNNGVRETTDSYELPEGVNGGVAMPKKFFNEEGELDLRLATGDQAVGYLRALGINILPSMRF